ncbi:MAG TPA: hypothetical protein VGK25_04380, partial [Ignavibacteria bacterium]
KGVIVSFLAVIMLMAVGVAIFLFSTDNSSDYKKVEKIFESSDDKDVKKDTKPSDNERKKKFPDDEFILGSKYLAEKDYDKAEEHLKKIKKDSEYYQQAQELLKNMKYLRKYDPKR